MATEAAPSPQTRELGRNWKVSSAILAAGLAWLCPRRVVMMTGDGERVVRFRVGAGSAHASAAAAPVAPFNGSIVTPSGIDIAKLDHTVAVFYSTPDPHVRGLAELELEAFQDNPIAWQYVPNVLDSQASSTSKIWALKVLSILVTTRWKILPQEQRDGIKNFLSGYVIRMSNQPDLPVGLRNKCIAVLLEVVKHEWPRNWPTLIPDMIAACQTSSALCTNMLVFMKSLSQNIYQIETMVKAKEVELRESLKREFTSIYQLCLNILESNPNQEVVLVAVQTLYEYVRWVPLEHIFSTPTVAVLVKLLPMPEYRNDALKTLTEIVAQPRPPDVPMSAYVELYRIFSETFTQMVPPGTDLKIAYKQATMDDKRFIEQMSFFFTELFGKHEEGIETANKAGFAQGIDYLIEITKVANMEMFNTCLQFWRHFAQSFVRPGRVLRGRNSATERNYYAPQMHRLREFLVTRMAKPEEVLVVEDEYGNIVRETDVKDGEVARYRVMREIMRYLTVLDHEDTEDLLREHLKRQVSGEFKWDTLNTICWAIGSISGMMSEDQESRFLVSNIRDLLNLCETARGKNNKAVIASNIMYVVGQYPNFLRAHWRFLYTVVQKLFEFMHESHPGVQDMACNTFLKIVKKCRSKFITVQSGESSPYLEKILLIMPDLIKDLEPQQQEVFYEAVAVLIHAVPEPTTKQLLMQQQQQQQQQQQGSVGVGVGVGGGSPKKCGYLSSLMKIPDHQWGVLVASMNQNPSILKDTTVLKKFLAVLNNYIATAKVVGGLFLPELLSLRPALAQVYHRLSAQLNQIYQERGPTFVTSLTNLIKTVRRGILNLYLGFVDNKATEPKAVAEHVLKPLIADYLTDYKTNAAMFDEAKQPELLGLFAKTVEKLAMNKDTKPVIVSAIPVIFDHVFETTINAITKNMDNYPDLRLKFYSLLKIIFKYCFESILALNDAQTKMMVDSVIWAMRHLHSEVADLGMDIFLVMLVNYHTSVKCNHFFQNYMLTLVQELLAVLTDTFHKGQFKLHAMSLQRFIIIASSPNLTVQLWNSGMGSFKSNSEFIHSHMINLLRAAFPNVHPNEVKTFVDGLYQYQREPKNFKQYIRDFIIQTKEFSNLDNQELYREEQQQQQAQQQQAEDLEKKDQDEASALLPAPE